MQASFDPEFQKHIIASFLEKNLGEGCDCLKAEYFEDELLGDIAEVTSDFYGKTREAPTKEALIHEIKERGPAPGRKFTEYIDVLEEIYEKIGDNGSYYRGKALEFSHSKVLAASLKEAYRLLEQGSKDDALAEIQKSISRNGHDKDLTHDFFEKIDERAQRYFDLKEGVNPEGRIGTGFSLLDARIQGGLGAGETGVIIAPPKHGKTTALISLAAFALLAKRRVLYVTLELSQRIISSKFDTNLFGRDLEAIKRKPKSFRDRLRQIKEELTGANLHIAEFPTKGLSLFKLQGLIEKIRPEIVFLDYAALLSSRTKDERRHELSDIHEGLRGVAGACQVPIWTAHQANRGALTRREIGMENVAEDFNIIAIADTSISLNQSEDERRQGELRLFIMGNRLGASGDAISCKVDWKISKIVPGYGDDDVK